MTHYTAPDGLVHVAAVDPRSATPSDRITICESRARTAYWYGTSLFPTDKVPTCLRCVAGDE